MKSKLYQGRALNRFPSKSILIKEANSCSMFKRRGKYLIDIKSFGCAVIECSNKEKADQLFELLSDSKSYEI